MVNFEELGKTALLEQREGCIAILEDMKKGSWNRANGLVQFAFDMANLACAIARLNKELVLRKIAEPVSFPEEFLSEAVEMFKKDWSYEIGLKEFKELVPITPIEIVLPNWF